MGNILQSLINIQQRLDAPKNKTNNFGHYKYRSLEDIEEAIKPLLKEHSCGIRFADEVVDRCGRTFLKTTLTFFNVDGESISTTAEAEHSTQKSGMDASQITGAASSYARKYAMNALFAIDDSKDADTDEYTNQVMSGQQKPAPAKPQTAAKPRTQAAKPQIATENKYAQLNAALAKCTKVDELTELYKKSKDYFESDPEAKKLLSMRKTEILSQQKPQ